MLSISHLESSTSKEGMAPGSVEHGELVLGPGGRQPDVGKPNDDPKSCAVCLGQAIPWARQGLGTA